MNTYKISRMGDLNINNLFRFILQNLVITTVSNSYHLSEACCLGLIDAAHSQLGLYAFSFCRSHQRRRLVDLSGGREGEQRRRLGGGKGEREGSWFFWCAGQIPTVCIKERRCTISLTTLEPQEVPHFGTQQQLIVTFQTQKHLLQTPYLKLVS